jgi:hypothetical protein
VQTRSSEFLGCAFFLRSADERIRAEAKENTGVLRLRLAQGAPNFAQDDGSNYWMTMVEGG